VQDLNTSSPQRADLRLLAISALYFQISENNSKRKNFKELLQLAFLLLIVIFFVAHIMPLS